MNNRMYAHRNLNALKANPSSYAYSYGHVTGKVGKGKLIGHEFGDMVLTDVVANCQAKTLQKIADGDYRSVAAWLIGTRTTARPKPTQKLRRFSIDPKRGDTEYKWSDTRETVVFPANGFGMVWLKKDGCYVVA